MRIPALIFLFLCMPAHAQVSSSIEPAKIEAPKPKEPRIADKKFWTMTGFLAASAAADYVTTRRLVDRGGYETNPAFGRHPSNARLAAVGGAIFLGEVALSYELKKFGRRHRWARHLWLADPGEEAAFHVFCAVHNERIR